MRTSWWHSNMFDTNKCRVRKKRQRVEHSEALLILRCVKFLVISAFSGFKYVWVCEPVTVTTNNKDNIVDMCERSLIQNVVATQPTSHFHFVCNMNDAIIRIVTSLLSAEIATNVWQLTHDSDYQLIWKVLFSWTMRKKYRANDIQSRDFPWCLSQPDLLEN